MIRVFKKISTVAVVSLTFAVGLVSTASSETTLSSRNVYSLCTTEDMDWINFYDGLIQDYADYAVLTGNACIPSGTTTTMITILQTNYLIVRNKNNYPALAAAEEILSRVYSCR